MIEKERRQRLRRCYALLTRLAEQAEKEGAADGETLPGDPSAASDPRESSPESEEV